MSWRSWSAAVAIVVSSTACPSSGRDPDGIEPPRVDHVAAAPDVAEREAMVNDQIVARGVEDPRVLDAMRRVPRHRFLPPGLRPVAYEDHPVRIGHGQTISQPYIVALMSELAEVKPGDRVLEIGTGSGYQAAVLAEMGAEVWSIEIVEPLANAAEALLGELGHDRVRVRHGDGYAGWPSEAPFDVVLLTAAPPQIPRPLVDQLAPGGRLVAPVGTHYQELIRIRSTPDGLQAENILPVRFVPMTGRVRGGPGE